MVGPPREIAADVRGAVIPFCGHLLREEQPEAVAKILVEFLEQR